jgi:DNA-binding MarR family transcriptional regulator
VSAPTPDVDLGTALHHLVAALDRKADALLRREFGVSLSTGRLLVVLAEVGPVSQHELALKLSVSDPAISRAMEHVTSSGLAEVHVDPAHRGRRVVTLTRTGRERTRVAQAALERRLHEDLEQAGVDVGLFTSAVAALRLQVSR